LGASPPARLRQATPPEALSCSAGPSASSRSRTRRATVARCVRLLTLLSLLLVASACGSSSPPTPDLIFVSTRDGDYALFGVAADGGDEHRLTKQKGNPATPSGLFFQTAPAWSPNGTRIAFASRRDGPSHVFVMGLDGQDVRPVTSSARD